MKKVYELEDLDCANCARKMQEAIEKLDEINSASVNFLTQKMTLDIADNADVDALMKKIKKIC
ncbi:MAG: heavy-metal-associated domain-containing protein, partial [Clostridia bacterium]|nr:heavy-metal-associated domain-containing protein [Clostridia bacterium]